MAGELTAVVKPAATARAAKARVAGSRPRVVRLRRVDCNRPGWSRRRFGKGFAYFDQNTQRIVDADVISRINGLVIPPQWKNVWICPLANGHIQATGFDARGRRQYLYHPRWRELRDREKFERSMAFARCLPELRAKVAADLARGDFSQQHVLGCAVSLLDLGFFRIGSEGYAEENETYGLATMLKSHVHIDAEVISFDFIAKSGKRRVQSVVDEGVRAVVVALKRRRGGGDKLLAYKATPGRGGSAWVDLRSDDINRYLKQTTGIECSAKDFRTWNATVLAAVALGVAAMAPSPTARKRSVRNAMVEVSHYLGNTPAVARASYVDPRIIDRYDHDETIAADLGLLGVGGTFGRPATRGPIEEAVLALLQEGEATLLEAV